MKNYTPDTYDPAIEDEDVDEYEEAEVYTPSALLQFFTFRSMVTPALIQMIYAVGLGAITLVSLLMMFGAVLPSAGLTVNLNGIIVGMLLLTLGNLIWRLVCEKIILSFRIHDALVAIEDQLAGN
jgi:hypothetical protein